MQRHSGIDLFYYGFYMFALFEDTLSVRNTVSSRSLVLLFLW